MRLASRRSWVPADPPPSLPPPGWPLSIDMVLLSTGSGVASLLHSCCCVVLATTCPLWATVFHLTTGKGAFNGRALRRGLLIDQGWCRALVLVDVNLYPKQLADAPGGEAPPGRVSTAFRPDFASPAVYRDLQTQESRPHRQ